MDLFVYSDESGVFDKVHNQFFVFAGLIFLGKEAKEVANRKYIHAERQLKLPEEFDRSKELKAAVLNNIQKGKLFRSLNGFYKFGGIVTQENVNDQIFKSKKDKQRYLDYVYKISVKRAFQRMIKEGIINPDEIERIHFFVDEHTTATNGRYELKEALEQEFKHGTYNWNYVKFYPPIFPNLKDVDVLFCNSEQKPLIRAADISANKLYHFALSDNGEVQSNKFYTITSFP